MSAVVVVGLVAALVLVMGDDSQSPDEVLAATQHAVADASSFRFTLEGEDVMVEGDGDVGTETTTRVRGEGEWTDDRWHVVLEDGYEVSESVLADDTTYDRWASDAAALQDEQWEAYEYVPMTHEDLLAMVEIEADFLEEGMEEVVDDETELLPATEGEVDASAVFVATGLYLGEGAGIGGAAMDAVSDPTGYLEAIEDLSEPTEVGDGDATDGVTTLAGTLRAPADVVDAFGRPIPEGRVELDVGPDDLPTALRLGVSQGTASASTEIRFTEWSGPVEIIVPSGDDVDETPWIDEEELRAISAFTPVVPGQVPEGWALSFVEYYPAEDPDDATTADGCESISLWWEELPELPEGNDFGPSDVDPAELGYLSLRVFSADCALAADPTPFAPGGPAGLPSRRNAWDSVEVLVGNTVVEVEDTTLDDAQRDAVLATLAPTDVEALIAQAEEVPDTVATEALLPA